MAKKSKKTVVTLKRLEVIEKLVTDMGGWEPQTLREHAQEERRRALSVAPNEELLSEFENAFPDLFEKEDATYVVEGSADPEDTFETLLAAIEEEGTEHENQVNEANGALAGAEHRGSDFFDALRIAWKLLTPDQRKEAFAEFKQDHDFVPLPGALEG